MRDTLQPQRCARVLRAVADPDRLRIIRCLMDGPRHVSQIADRLGLQLANVSHHLAVLRHAGLVRCERHGRFLRYELDRDTFHLAKGGGSCLDFGCCRLELPDPPAANGPRR